MCEYVCIPYGLTIDGRNEGEYDRRERVVRCRDCEFYEDGCCTLLEFAASNMDNGFCAWAEPREED